MSMSGQRLLELERERAEALRLQQVRAEGTEMIEQCEVALRSVRDEAVQQLAAAELGEAAGDLAGTRGGIEEDPDAALPLVREVRLRIERAVAHAEARARQWSEEQSEAMARARAARAHVQAATSAAEGLGGSAEQAEALAAEAAAHAEAGRIEEARRAAEAASDAARSLVRGAVDERIRREVVRGLLQTMKEMGFVVSGPQINEGIVVLDGRLASGRRARFEVHVSGRMDFDLDGYEGRACADDMQKVEEQMRDRFGVKLGPPQVVWKNPDRLSQGARDLPGGGRTARR